MNNWIVGLSSWIIQDGNCPDFVRGQRASFALEFYSKQALTTCTEVAPSCSPINNEGRYDVSGRVIHVAEDWWAIDIGVIVFRQERPPAEMSPGRCVRGEIAIGIDPYFYFEQLAKRVDSPALIYDWNLEKIEIQTAPMIQIAPKRLGRDERLLGWREVERTDAWNDDDGHGWYLLHCSRIDGPPRHSLR